MADLTNYAETTLCAVIPSPLFVKLHIGDPGEDATANPAVETTRKSVAIDTAVDGVRQALADAVWTEVAATEEYTHISAWSAGTNGNPWYKGELGHYEGEEWVPTPKSVDAGDGFTIPAEDLSVGLA